MMRDTMKAERIEDRGWRIEKGPGAGAILYRLSSILFCLTALTGCTVVGALAHKVVGNPAVPPQYVPAMEPLLVLVENYSNPDSVRLDAQRLSLHVVDELRKRRVAPVVDPDTVESLRARPEYATMKVEEIGRAAGAGQVLYISLKQFSVDNTVGGEMMKGRAEMRLRVVDAKTGHTRWPRDVPEGRALTAETSWVRSTVGSREGASEPALRDQVARTAAEQIVKLFRKWDPDDEEQDLEETVH